MVFPKSLFYLIILTTSVPSSANAQTYFRQAKEVVSGHEVTLGLLYGGSANILVDGKIVGNLPNVESANFLNVYHISGASVVLIESSTGSDCAYAYNALTFSPEPFVSRKFGTCNKLVSITVTDASVIVKIPEIGNTIDPWGQALPSKTEFEVAKITRNGLITKRTTNK